MCLFIRYISLECLIYPFIVLAYQYKKKLGKSFLNFDFGYLHVSAQQDDLY